MKHSYFHWGHAWLPDEWGQGVKVWGWSCCRVELGGGNSWLWKHGLKWKLWEESVRFCIFGRLWRFVDVCCIWQVRRVLFPRGERGVQISRNWLTAGHRAAKGQEDDDGRNLYRADNTAWLGGLRMSSTGDTNDATQSMIIQSLKDMIQLNCWIYSLKRLGRLLLIF